MTRLSLLVDLAAMLRREVDLDTLLSTACQRLASALDADRATLWLVDAEKGDLFTHVAVLPEVSALRQPIDRGLSGYVARTGETLRIDDVQQDERFDPSADRKTGFVTRSMLATPVREREGGAIVGVVQVIDQEPGAFGVEDVLYLQALSEQLAQALSLTSLAPRADGIRPTGQFNHIVGLSEAMQPVYERILLAAPTPATVLLTGETGTGKSLLARAVHANSMRQGNAFVLLDCTTLPGELIESELFGHERGAFTGADRRVRGRVELAQGGTLFLDEVGDLTAAAQAKLLRLLQERTFERVGGRETLEADVRVVAATHRNLQAAIGAGRFREDLYYRLKVVEIGVPPLRVRGGDEIERLAQHFAKHYAKRYERPTPKWAPGTMAALRAHDWPGNVRELEHWVESRVVLCRDGVLSGSPGEGAREPSAVGLSAGVSLPLGLPLEEASRRYIAATLEAQGGNRTRAAELLGIGRNRVARAAAQDED